MLPVLVVALGAACARVARPTPEPDAQPHLGDTWYAHRALSLGITEADAHRRDLALSEESASDGMWDRTTQQEASALWQSACASCHGLTGKGDGAAPMNPAPRSFGTMGMRMGFFFGGDRMRAGIYRKITEGGAKTIPPTAMPAYGPTLSREQRWALVYLIESL
jgi:mono/diheme cytochrome c family protein